jgi:hypothetical protein
MSIELNEIKLSENNLNLAKSSIDKLLLIVSGDFKNEFDPNKVYLQVIILVSEVVKEVERLSTSNKLLLGKDKKDLAIYIGATVLSEIFDTDKDRLDSYMKIYNEYACNYLETVIGVAKTLNEEKNKIIQASKNVMSLFSCCK